MKLLKLIRTLSKKTIIAILALIVIGIPLLYLTVLNSKPASAWFDENWLYRKSIAVTNNTTGQSNVYISITLDTSDTTRFKTGCGDLRFTKQGGDLLPYYIVSGCGGATTVIHVNFDTFPAGAQTIYYYYGNPSASDGFNNADFSTVASNYTVGSLGSEEQSTGPVAYWKFDEGQGAVANDSTTNKNNGNLGVGISAPSWQTEDQCISGKCLYFYGNSASRVTVASVISSIKTISFWVKPKTNTAALLDLDGGTHTINATSGTISANGFSNKTIYVNGATSTTLTANTWQMITVTTTDTINSTSSFKLGTDNSTFLNGFMDDVKIYNFVKNAAQIKQDYMAKTGAATNQGSSAVMGASNQSYLSQGLVGYWKMDEASGNAADSSGNGNTLSNSNTATFTTGKFGNGASLLDASSQSFSKGSMASSVLSLSNTFTISIWVNPTSFPAFSSGIVKYGSVGGSEQAYRLSASSSVITAFLSTDGSSTSYLINKAYALPTATWTLITWTIDGTSSRIFVNGALIATGSFSGTPHVPGGANDTFVLGGRENSFWNGSLDEARVYNRALSPKEVSDLYNWAPGPVVYYNFEEGSGTAVNDTSGNGINGTWTKTAGGQIASDWGTGKIGKASNFVQGASSSVWDTVRANSSATVNNLPGTDLATNFSGEAWIYLTAGASDWAIYKTIMSKLPVGKGWEVYTNTTNKNLTFAMVTTVTTYNTSTANNTLSLNAWNHVAFIWNGSTKTPKLYINGIDVTPTSPTAATGTIDDSGGTFWVGNAQEDNHGFNGQIDEVKLFNYARTQKQIVSDMNGGHPAVGSPIGSAVGYWDFDEGQGTTANNSGSGGSSLNGTLTNMATAPSTSTSGWNNQGKFGKALNFDGTTDFVDAGNNSALQITGSLTISAWVNFSAIPGANNIIVDKDKDTPTASRGFSLAFDSTGKVYFLICQNASGSINTYFPTTSTLSPNTWYHVVAVYSAGSFATIYINGKADATVTSSVVTSINNSTNNLGIGKRITGTAYPFTGSIDEVKIYNYALTADEVKTEYNHGQSIQMGAAGNNSTYQPGAANQEYCMPGDTTSCAAPVGRWDFEEKVSGDSKTVLDTSGSGGSGTTHYGANTAGMNCVIPGKIGNSCKFDGVDDYIDVGNGTPLQITSSITIEAWVKLTSTANGIFPRVVSKLTGSNYNGYELLISPPDDTYPNTPYLQLGINNALRATKNTAVPLSLNTWYHLAGVYNATAGEGYLYLNGALVSTGTPWGASGLGSSALNVNIGRWVGGASNYFPGQIDNVRIFDYARTPAQVAWDYNRGGPVGYWDLDECQGTVANDSSGQNHTGTITIGTGAGTGQQDSAGTCTASGATAWYNGRIGKRNASLNFDGIDDYINVGTWNPAPGAVTMSAWIYPATTARDGLEHVIIAKGNDQIIGSPGPSFLLNNSQGDVLCMEIATDTLRYACSPIGAVTPNAWNHVVGIYNGSNSCTVYVNGVLKTGGTANACSGSISGSQTVWIGAQNRAGTCNGHSCTYPFKGQIDDAKIFNYALTPSQIKDIYNGGAINYGPVTGSP